MDVSQLSDLLGALIDQGWAQRLESDAVDTPSFMATDEGERALSEWDFSEEVGERTTKTLRIALDVMRFSPEDRKIINRKVAEARAQRKERLGLVEAVRMRMEAERHHRLRRPKAEKE